MTLPPSALHHWPAFPYLTHIQVLSVMVCALLSGGDQSVAHVPARHKTPPLHVPVPSASKILPSLSSSHSPTISPFLFSPSVSVLSSAAQKNSSIVGWLACCSYKENRPLNPEDPLGIRTLCTLCITTVPCYSVIYRSYCLEMHTRIHIRYLIRSNMCFLYSYIKQIPVFCFFQDKLSVLQGKPQLDIIVQYVIICVVAIWPRDF